MYIKCTKDSTQSLKLDWMDEPVEFASTGTAQVNKETGERLIEELDAIEPHEEDNE